MAGHIASSSNIDWCTPLWITDGIREVFDDREIHLDPCSNLSSIHRVKAVVNFRLPQNDGLKDSWTQTMANGQLTRNAYVNPPFGAIYTHRVTKEVLLPKAFREVKQPEIRAQYERSTIADWVRRCSIYAPVVEIAQLGPANCDTQAWHTYIEGTASAALYVEGRIAFELIDPETGAVVGTGPAPMPCALAYWGHNVDRFRKIFRGRRREGGRGAVRVFDRRKGA